MIIIESTSEDFTLNGVRYDRVYHPIANGEHLAIHNVYDSRQQILGSTHFSEIRINGYIASTMDATLGSLIPILHNHGSGSGSGGGSVSNITQIPYRSYNDLQDLPILGDNVIIKSSLEGNKLTLTLGDNNEVTSTTTIDLSDVVGTGGGGDVDTTNGIVKAVVNSSRKGIIFTRKDGTTFDVSLSGLTVSSTSNGSGVTTITQGDIAIATLSKAGKTGQYGDLLNKPDLNFEPAFTKRTAFNKNFGNSAGTVAEGDDARILNGQRAYDFGDHSKQGYITGINNITDIPNRSYLDLQDLPDINEEVTVVDNNANTDKHLIATVAGKTVSETVTKLNTPSLNGNILSIKMLNENGVEQVVTVDLSTIITNESGISNATYNAATNIITLDEVDGDQYTIDLSEFSIIPNTDVNGVTTLTQENEIKVTVSKVGQSGQFVDLLGTSHLESKTGAQAKADAAESAAKTHADNGDAATLSTAKSYTDDAEADANQYTDDREVVIKQYSDDGDEATLSSAKGYTDDREVVIKQYADDGDEATLSSAKQYTDDREVVIKQYSDDNDATTLQSAKDYAEAIKNNLVRIVRISETDMTEYEWSHQGVVDYLNDMGLTIADDETVMVFVGADGYSPEPEQYHYAIDTPTQGEELTVDEPITITGTLTRIT